MANLLYAVAAWALLVYVSELLRSNEHQRVRFAARVLPTLPFYFLGTALREAISLSAAPLWQFLVPFTIAYVVATASVAWLLRRVVNWG